MSPMSELPVKSSLDGDGDVAHMDEEMVVETKSSSASDVSEEEAKRIMWKIDRRLIVVTGLCYCISLMDRGNLGVAVVAG